MSDEMVKQEMRDTPLSITAHGDAIVNYGKVAYVFEESENLAAILVDMETKRIEFSGHCNGDDDEGPEIFISAIGGDRMTAIRFDEFAGWHVWAVDTCKYTAHVCLIRRDEK